MTITKIIGEAGYVEYNGSLTLNFFDRKGKNRDVRTFAEPPGWIHAVRFASQWLDDIATGKWELPEC